MRTGHKFPSEVSQAIEAFVRKSQAEGHTLTEAEMVAGFEAANGSLLNKHKDAIASVALELEVREFLESEGLHSK